MSSILNWTNIGISLLSLIFVLFVSFIIKNVLYKIKKPNGKKGGIISFHVALAFTIVSIIALTTKDWFITAMVIILAYLIGREKLDNGQHYLYQITISAVLGVLVPYGIFYFYINKFTNVEQVRETYDDKPESAVDDRHEADEAPELRLEDIKED
jgi:hypothetical protein